MSPTPSKSGGFWLSPTPQGVPVVTTSPGCRLMNLLRYERETPAALALYLASDEAIFTAAQCHVVDGGWSN